MTYQLAKDAYAAIGVDTDAAIRKMYKVIISLHCWEADDIGGFKKPEAVTGGGGILATRNAPGKVRTIDQLRKKRCDGYILDEPDKVQAFARQNGVNYPVLLGSDEISMKYGGIEGIPTTFSIDKSGKIVNRFEGFRPRNIFETEIKKWL